MVIHECLLHNAGRNRGRIFEGVRQDAMGFDIINGDLVDNNEEQARDYTPSIDTLLYLNASVDQSGVTTNAIRLS